MVGKGKGKGKEVVDAKAASLPHAVASSSASAGKRKRPLSVVSPSPFSPGGYGLRGSGSGQKKRRGRAPASRFIDDAAIDDGDDCDEFDDNEDGDDGVPGEEDTEFTNDIRVQVKYAKGAGKSSIPFFLKEEELSGDELDELVKERYGDGSDQFMFAEDDKECDDRKSLLHSTNDPTIFKVKCMVGHERHIAFCFVQKYVALHNLGSDLPIVSVFSLEHIKGYVYIEANKQRDVIEACKGFCTLYTSKIGLVPIDEVLCLLSVQNKSSGVTKGMWVRMKNGRYKGDLAQVVAVDAIRKRATVKLVPRVDLQALAKKFGGGISLKGAAIPAPRLISSHELEDFRPNIEIRHDRETGELFEILDGLMLKDGYLYKRVSILSLSCFGVQPLSAELMKFEPAKKDEPQISEYISHLCGGRKKNGSETLDNSLEDEGDSLKLHDLLLFGRKDFGVIIGIKCDSFQVLKGNPEGQAVVTVLRKDIKKSCVDKMFTALDSHMKTICINDIVKVLEGPLKDRQGIVKHMFRGTLFIYDEENLENSGFSCAKSELCEVMKENRRVNMGHKSFNIGSKEPAESSSMLQSPTKCNEERNCYSGSFKRYHQSDRDERFTVGQSLRIRVGLLKGYLCRVVRIHRSDVTVKLDSMAKLITVNCNHLSDANVRNFGSTRNDTMPNPDLFGSEESLVKGEPVNEDMRVPPSESSWDFEPPSNNRASWPRPSVWGTSSASGVDNIADEVQGDDPWGSKVPSGQSGHSENAGSQPAMADGWSNWVNAEKSTECEQETWNRNTANEVDKGSWGNAEHWNSGAGTSAKSDVKGFWEGQTDKQGNLEPGQGFGRNWGGATIDSWGNRGKAEKSAEGENGSWKGNVANEGETGGWSKTTSSNIDQADGWDKGAGASGESDHKGVWEGHTNKLECFKSGWGFGGNCAEETLDDWSNQDSTLGEHEGWKGNNSNERETGGWTKGMPSSHGKADCWNKGARASGESSGKATADGSSSGDKEGASGESSGKANTDGRSCWDKAGASGESSDKTTTDCQNIWDKAVASGGSSGKTITDCQNTWDKAGASGGSSGKTTDGWSNWDRAEKSAEGKHESWKGSDLNEGITVGWGKSKPSNCDQAERRSKETGAGRESGVKVDWGGHSERPEHFEGRQGFGCGGNRGNSGDRNQDSGWSKCMDSGGDQGSLWGGGRSRNNEADGFGDAQDRCNRSRDIDAGRGRGRERGRGFDGSWNARNEEYIWKGSEYSHGRGGPCRGRGRRGRGTWDAGGNCSWQFGHGKDEDQSSVWKNDQGSSGHGDSSGNALSSWHSDQTSGWGSSTEVGKTGVSDDKLDQTHSWSGKEPFVGGSSGWNNDNDLIRNEVISWESKEKQNMNQGCGWNIGDKSGAKADKHVDGEQPATWQKGEAPSKWSAPEVQSNWSHSPARANARDEDWSIKSNPSRADQLGGNMSTSTGHQSSAWVSQSAENEKFGKDDGSGGSWDRIEQSDAGGSGNQRSSRDSLTEHCVNGSAAAGNNWAKGNTFLDEKTSESSNWHMAKAFAAASVLSDWGRKSSGDQIGRDAGSGVGNWDNPKPSGLGSKWRNREVGGGNWNGSEPGPGVKQASNLNKYEGNNWDKQTQYGNRSSLGGNNDWSADDLHGDRSGGKSYGVDPSFGWEANISSGTRNGRGRHFGQEEQHSGWSGGTHTSCEAGGADFPEFSGRPKSYGSDKSTSWSHDIFAEKDNGSKDGNSDWSRGKCLSGKQSLEGKGTSGEEVWRQEPKGKWGSRDSEMGDRACGSVRHSDWNNSSASTSGWTSSGPVDLSKLNASAWNERTSTSRDAGWGPDGTDSCSKLKELDSNGVTGWNSALVSTKGFTAGEGEAWNQKDSGRADAPGGWGKNH